MGVMNGGEIQGEGRDGYGRYMRGVGGGGRTYMRGGQERYEGWMVVHQCLQMYGT